MPAPALTDDIFGEVLLRFPPDEPELLVRATLVCKRWLRLISDPRFRRRFRELHRAVPMLGIFCANLSTSRFVPTSSVPLPHAIRFRGDWRAMDARHGRVLLNTASHYTYHFNCSGDDLVVWDPVTGDHHRLPKLAAHMYPQPDLFCWTAAVLCAAAEGGCDHLDCHRGPFLVVFMCTGKRQAFACVYSSETDAWSGPASAQLRYARARLAVPSAVVGNALHFMSGGAGKSYKILKHVLGTQVISLICVPHKPYRRVALMTMVDGGLGFAAVRGSKLDLRSRVSGTKAYAGWAQSHTIYLETIDTLPTSLHIICCMDGITAIFMGMEDRPIFVINLKSQQIRKIPEGRVFDPVVPYMCFYTPDEPELLVRAALVCKRWFRLISDPRFRRRFRELHRTAPVLGLFCADYSTSRFVLRPPAPRHPLPRRLARHRRAPRPRPPQHREAR